MTKGEKIVIEALKREFKRLSRIAEKAKAEAEENMNIATEMLAIHKEFAAIVNAKEHGEHVLRKLNALKKRRDKAQKILDKDLLTLLNKQSDAEIERDSLGSEIQRLEFRHSLRQRAS